MRKLLFMGLAALGLIFTGCKETSGGITESPASVKIENSTSTIDQISFDLIIENSIEAGYLTLKSDDVTNSSLTQEAILENSVKLESAAPQSVVVENLDANTSYVTVAYAKGAAGDIAITMPMYCKTAKGEDPATVKLENISALSSELTFKISPSNAVEAGYSCIAYDEVTEDSFAEDKIVENSTKLEEVKVQEINIKGLLPETKYAICAYALNAKGDMAISDTLFITTDVRLANVGIHIKEISTTTESITFEITPENNPESCYWWFYKMTDDYEEKDSQTIVSCGEKTSNVVTEQFTREGLLDGTTYVVYAVAVVSGTYQQVMDRLEITTPALDNPVQVDVQEFHKAEFSTFGGRNHSFSFENADYVIDVVLQSPVCFDPCVPVGEYTYNEQGAGGIPWAIATTTTNIIDKKDGNKSLVINRGSATLDYDSASGDYTLEGSFQTSENINIPYKFVGSITYPIMIRYNFGLYNSEENMIDFDKADDNYKLKVYLAEGVSVADGEYSFENGKLSDKTLVEIFDYDGTPLSTLKFKELSFYFKQDGATSYDLSATGVTTEGYAIALAGEGLTVDVTKQALPELPVLTLTNPRVLCEYAGGWDPYYYSLEFDCDELQTFFVGLALGEGGDYIPEGSYSYMEESGSFQYFEVKTNSGSNYKFYDEGGVDISLDGDTYTIEFAVRLWMGSDDRMFKAKYVGPIDVDFEDNSGGSDDYYYAPKN